MRTLDGASGRSMTWDARDDHGRNLPAGVYYLGLEGAATGSSRITLLR